MLPGHGNAAERRNLPEQGAHQGGLPMPLKPVTATFSPRVSRRDSGGSRVGLADDEGLRFQHHLPRIRRRMK